MSGQDNTEINVLLGNIKKGLKKHSLREINQALVSFLRKKNGKRSEIGVVMDIVCEEFGIMRNELRKKGARGDTHLAKELTCCLLHFNFGFSFRFISVEVFDTRNHYVVTRAIKRYRTADENHKQDAIFLNKYENLQEKLIKKLQSKKQSHENLH